MLLIIDADAAAAAFRRHAYADASNGTLIRCRRR